MRDIPGYEKIYAVDRQGNVWRIGAPRGRPLKPVLVEGYCRVVLSKGGVKKRFFVHQLMLRTYVGPKPEGTEPRHRNGVRTDNWLRNLAYGTHQENIDDRKRHGNWKQFGETAYQAKLTEAQVREIRATPRRIKDLPAEYGVSRATIDAIRCGRNWKHVR